jgi:hypothetical protein
VSDKTVYGMLTNLLKEAYSTGIAARHLRITKGTYLTMNLNPRKAEYQIET